MINLPLNVDFTGKVVVVTGAGGVLCGDMARAYAQAGAKVAALDLNEEAVKKLAAGRRKLSKNRSCRKLYRKVQTREPMSLLTMQGMKWKCHTKSTVLQWAESYLFQAYWQFFLILQKKL